jgi:hypothetical protein
LDFVVRANEKPEELLIPTGCVWDAYMFVCDLVRSAERKLVLVDNFVDERVLAILDKRKSVDMDRGDRSVSRGGLRVQAELLRAA